MSFDNGNLANHSEDNRNKIGNIWSSNLNINRYATKKTLAQGLLDLTLLATNVTQLMALLDYGTSHPYYTVLLALISTSICLETLQAIACVILGIFLDLNKIKLHKKADWYNNISLVITIIVTVVNLVIKGFDYKIDSQNSTLN